MAKKYKHVHRYKRDVLGRNYIIYKCTLPGCTHYIPENLLINRVAMCGTPGCEEQFVIDKKKALQAIPRCDKHTESHVTEVVTEIDKILEENA